MRNLIVFLTLLLGLSLLSCSESSTGTESNTDNNNDEIPTYNVSVNMNPSDAGSLSISDTTVDKGEEIELQANSNNGYVFTEWSGDIESTDNPHSLTVDQDFDINANFEIKSYELTVNKEGEGTVSEEVLEQKSKEYEHGTVVELTANPAEGYRFVEWQGDVTRSDNPAQITIDDPKEVTAVFEKKSYALTINTYGEGAVAEEVVQQKSTDYEYGTVVELTANSAEGWKFKEWSGANTSSDNPIKITVDSQKEITANFEKKSFDISVNVEGNGSVSKSPDQQTYTYNSTVQLEASPSEGYEFVEWSNMSSSDNPLELTVVSDTSLTAVFEKKSYPLNVSIEGEGTVTKNPEQIEYEHGTTIELTANPSKNWEFVEWKDDTSSTDNPIEITIESETNITAVYQTTVTNLNVSVDWTELENVPEEIFSGENSNSKTSSGTNKKVTDFGIRVEYLSRTDAFAKSLSYSGNETAHISFPDIPTADSVAIYALAVNTDDKAENGSPYAKKLGAIQNMVLEDSTNYELTSSDFEWFAPSWGVGPDFEESGWDTARVDKSVSRAEIEFYAVNPFDKPYKTGSNTDHDGFIMRLSGIGRDGDYQGNNIREYIYVQDHPNPGTQDTVEVEYSWAPYVHSDWFGLPEYSYMIDLKSKFIVIFE